MAHAIDHVIMAVDDLDLAGDRFERIGFTVSPMMRHPFGTANRLVMFDGNFIELLAVVDRNRLGGLVILSEFLNLCGEGLWALVFRTDDAAADHTAIEAKGLAVSPLRMLVERPVELPGGGETIARFSSFALLDGRATTYLEGFSQQHCPEAVWIPEWQRHANGARRIAKVAVAADDIDKFAARYEKLWGANTIRDAKSGFCVQTPTALLSVVHPDVPSLPALGPRICALEIEVSSLADTAALLRSSETSFSAYDTDSLKLDDGVLPGFQLSFSENRARGPIQASERYDGVYRCS